jgi:hypothetical protein
LERKRQKARQQRAFCLQKFVGLNARLLCALFLIGGLILLPAGAGLLSLPRLILHRGLTRLFVLLRWVRLVLLCHKSFLLTYQQAPLRARTTMLI